VFHKMTGSGNDFIMLDGRMARAEDWPAERIRQVCDRRFGVGADGFLVLVPEGPARVRMVFFNSDGSRAPMCGNAALCSTRLSLRLGLAPAEMTLVTDSGAFPTRSLDGVMAELNLPDFVPHRKVDIPLIEGEVGIWFAESGGPPHTVVVVKDIEAVDVFARGRELRYHPAFAPKGANINFVQDPRTRPSGQKGPLPMRTYERGVEGETLACGTGAVGCATLLAQQGLLTLPAELWARGGFPLTVRGVVGKEKVTNVWLAGEGRIVARGVLE
ncbi:MAG TPA: diaminopimelate epimerase, partial [Gemmatimonadales bacterium]|nr:diaminopimelate epimerase [Gemmatimonadales bacterium]